MTNDPMKLYTLHTRAPMEQVRDVVTKVVIRSGHTVLLEEGATTRTPWTRGRWTAALLANSIVALVFYFVPNGSVLAGYLLGWLVACGVLLW